MVRVLLILILISLSCCQKAIKEELKYYYETDYFDPNVDTMKFHLFRKITSIPFGTEVWTKVIDTIYPNTKYRFLSYQISNSDTTTNRNYFIRDNGILETAVSPNLPLTVYKPFLIEKEDSGVYYYERRNGFIRQYYSKFVEQDLSPFYNGNTIQSVIEKRTDVNDSTVVFNQGFEYYAFRKGIVKLKENKTKYISGVLMEDVTVLKIRYQ